MAKAKYNEFTRDWMDQLIKDKPLEEQIKILEIRERQKYNYYCDCSDRWTTEQCKEYESSWNEIIEMINELKAM